MARIKSRIIFGMMMATILVLSISIVFAHSQGMNGSKKNFFNYGKNNGNMVMRHNSMYGNNMASMHDSMNRGNMHQGCNIDMMDDDTITERRENGQ